MKNYLKITVEDVMKAKRYPGFFENHEINSAAVKAAFHVCMRKVRGGYHNNPELNKILKMYGYPFHESSLFKGIPNTQENRELFAKLFADIKKYTDSFDGYRLRRRYRGPRNKQLRGSYSAQSFCSASEGTSFALYLDSE